MGDTTSNALLLSEGGSAFAEGAGAFAKASAIRAQADAAARALLANASLAAFGGSDALKRGARLSQDKLQQAKDLIGRQRASFAAQGVEVNTGTPADIQADTAALGALDAEIIRENAAREFFAFRLQEINLQEQAAVTKIAAKGAARSTLITGGLNLVRGATQTGLGLSVRA